MSDHPSLPNLFSVVSSPAASIRLDAAHRFLSSGDTACEVLLVGDTREAVDELARDVSKSRGGWFGLHRFSLQQLALKLTVVELAARRLTPATRLGAEAVAARSAFEELSVNTLNYLAPIARLRNIGRTLAATLEDLRLANIDTERLNHLTDTGADLHVLAQRYEQQLMQAGLVDSAALLHAAALAAHRDRLAVPLDSPLLLLDVPVHDEATLALITALVHRASRVLATVPVGDERTLTALRKLPNACVTLLEKPANSSDALERVRHYLFTPTVPPESSGIADASSSVVFFSAPGESRECVEIARAILQEAARGVRFDRIAVLVRAPQAYAGLLETALGRAGVAGWFARGTRAPDPSGRAFLALLACATEQLSARRFSEYLSLAQVPSLEDQETRLERPRAWVAPASADLVLPVSVLGMQPSLFDTSDEHEEHEAESGDTDTQPVVAGSLRVPWRWDRLLVESAVIGGRDRWMRRLDGLTHELRVKRDERASEEPGSPYVFALDRDLRNLGHLKRFALPVIDRLVALPERASWGEWIDSLEALAPVVLKQPDRVLSVLGELRPMARVGPVPLAEVKDVLSERLTELQEDPPGRRYGRVFVGKPDWVRGRVFDVVFVPGLAERIFPQKQRQDPLLLDNARRALCTNGGSTPGTLTLPTQDDRATRERLLLRIATGAAAQRLFLSYPRIELSESRPRVPSFYALDIERARVGSVPDFRRLERDAFREAGARLAWPAPDNSARAIDDTEHDLAVLGPLLRQEVTSELKGRARYLLKLNPGLRRSLLTRWARWRHPWSRYDGLYDLSAIAKGALADYRLSVRPYSVSALQRFAVCPYQFLLSAIYRFAPREEIAPLEQMDPLTRGRMFHEVQAEFVHELRRRDVLPVTRARLSDAEQVLDVILDRIAATYKEDLAPAIDRVWSDDVESIRTDLKGWLHHVADEGGEWIPIGVEFGFGFTGGHGRDPESVSEPVALDRKWKLHGVVDLIEAKSGPTVEGELRVTDHKTGRNRTRERMVVGHGEVLQPVLYGLAIEQALRRPVQTSRLFFCTVTGEFTTRPITFGETERRNGLEVLEIIDRAVETGALLPAPRDGACGWCDFRDVCGPWEETRVKRKDETKLVDLKALRRMP